MRFHLRHETTYRYSVPVRLADHLLRLTPRPDRVTVLAQQIDVAPGPVWREDRRDGFGNPVTALGFAGETDLFRVTSHFTLDTFAPMPLPLGVPPLPWRGGMPEPAYLGQGEAPSVQAFAEGLAAEAGQDALVFLELLNRRLYERTDRHIRLEGDASDPAETLARGSGACRDLAVLFMAACRSLGIPARFVSGYQAQADSADGNRHLHAWPEVWLPGSGWHGYDPTHGFAVTDGHVALAVAPDQAQTMPMEGGFYANGVTATLDYRIEISTG